jgi:hypothetical protein
MNYRNVASDNEQDLKLSRRINVLQSSLARTLRTQHLHGRSPENILAHFGYMLKAHSDLLAILKPWNSDCYNNQNVFLNHWFEVITLFCIILISIMLIQLSCVNDYNFSAFNDVDDRMSRRKKKICAFGRCTRNVVMIKLQTAAPYSLNYFTCCSA